MSQALLPRERWRRRLVSTLVAVHLVIVPLGSYIAVRVPDAHGPWLWLARYVHGIRCQQLWELFSPEPRAEAIRYRAELRFRNGRTATWSRPYPPNWDFFARHLAYSFQKWDLVNNQLDHRTILWDGLTHYLETRFRDDVNPLIEIRFIRASAPWPPPRAHGYVGGEEGQLHWTDRTLFVWDVARKEFR